MFCLVVVAGWVFEGCDCGFVVFCVLLRRKKNLKNELNQREGRWICGHSACSVGDNGSAMGTCWWSGGFVKGGELLIQVWLKGIWRYSGLHKIELNCFSQTEN